MELYCAECCALDEKVVANTLIDGTSLCFRHTSIYIEIKKNKQLEYESLVEILKN